MIKNIAFVGYPVKDIEKARAFYEGVLGLVPSEEYGTEGPWIEYNIGSGTFAIGNMESWIPSKDGPTVAFEVDNLDELVAMLKEKEIEVTLDVQTFPSCKMAMIRDQDGNQVTLHQKSA
jgi:predicted enzyme related to lactoylglutathione lyase